MIPWPDLGIDGEPELLFQPAVDLATGRLLGFEALLRWNDPVQGRISPKELIPWAEANGHMTALNRWVLSEACARAVSWRSDIQLAVNCSVFQLRRNEAALAAALALEESGLQPDRLTIEVTETTLADDGAAADLRAISRLGIQLTVDDMGSDWSSLENLQHFAVNTMKIDGSLIDGIDHAGGVNRAIVETIVKVSHSLDLCTVAEAVETAAQVAILREVGADVGQGYFFAAPMGADEALALTSLDELPLFSLSDPAEVDDHESDPVASDPAASDCSASDASAATSGTSKSHSSKSETSKSDSSKSDSPRSNLKAQELKEPELKERDLEASDGVDVAEADDDGADTGHDVKPAPKVKPAAARDGAGRNPRKGPRHAASRR